MKSNYFTVKITNDKKLPASTDVYFALSGIKSKSIEVTQLPEMKNAWEFVEKYYPKYTSSDEIAYNNDLQKIVDNEINGCAKDLYEEMINVEGILEEDVVTIAQQRLNESNASIYEEAIENFLQIWIRKTC